ncbi:hypothetical protein FACS1894137_01510 [Spirochaetia bacterium]|nr:hypothetical protein FACS1894137_01510 [Spirochaetia bacterium]
MKKSEMIFAACLGAAVLFLSGCAGTPPANREADAVAAANAAVASMGGRPAGAPVNSPASGAAAANSDKTQPAWVNSPEAVYNRNTFVTGVGSGNSRDQAEKNAFTALSSVFHQSLQADQTISASYLEAVRNGASLGWTENTSVEGVIKTSTAMELVGAEIRDVWSDGKIFYALALMEKAAAARLYTGMIQDNQKIIDTLVPPADRNSLDSLARYQFAAALAEGSKVFANVLSVIGAPVPAGVKRPEDYRLEASNILKNIPVSVIVQNDRDDRIRAAFAGVFSAAGFRTGGGNSRYQLKVRLSLSEAQLPNQSVKFARYVVDGNFTDTAAGAVLFPYNINGREGHSTLSEAETRAVRAAENKIKEDYAEALSVFLSRLIPKK